MSSFFSGLILALYIVTKIWYKRTQHQSNYMVSNKQVIEQVLYALGLNLNSWTNLETIDAGCAFVIANLDLLENLPKKVRGNLSNLNSKDTKKRRQCICGFSRRLAKSIEKAILTKRNQVYINKRTESRYIYKLIQG